MNFIIKGLICILYSVRVRFILYKKISSIYNNLPSVIKIPKDNMQIHKKIWKKLNNRLNTKWYKVFVSISGKDDPRYITEFDYHFNVELRLNHKGFSEAYCDKNIYHRNFQHDILPKIYLRNINGNFYDINYETINFENALNNIPKDCVKIIVKKAIQTGGGRGIDLFKRIADEWINCSGVKLTTDFLTKTFENSYLIQEYIEQHNYFSQFNQSSLNTVRLFTYRSVITNEVLMLNAVLRIGQPGSFVDNQASGGIACGINSQGKLNSFAVNKKGLRIDRFNNILFLNANPVFKYDEIVKLCLPMAAQFYYHRLLGFDFCVDQKGNVKLIEVNNKNNETNFFQMSNGPLFGDYTDEIITYCKQNKRHFSFDFDLS